MNLKSYIDQIKENIALLDDINYTRDPNKWFESILSIIDKMQELINFLGASKDETAHTDAILNLNAVLMKIVEAMQNRDYVLVGDIILFELSDLLDTLL